MREFRQRNSKAERYWVIDINKRTVTTAWGAIIKDGTHKEHGTTKDVANGKGKAGTKGYVNAEDNAQFLYDRQIRKKTEEGYVEIDKTGEALLGESSVEIDHGGFLPKNLAFSKPNNSISEAKIAKLDAAGSLLYTRKMNGMCVIAHIRCDGSVNLYTRRMDIITPKFPHLCEALRRLRIPPNSILLFEAYMGDGDTKKDFKLVSRIMNADDDKAVQRQVEDGWAKFYLFRVPILDGQHLEAKYNNEACLLTIENAFTDMFMGYSHSSPTQGRSAGKFLSCIQVMRMSYAKALIMIQETGWEGFVVYIKDATIGAQSYRFTGKPERPPSCFKLKIAEEDDFIAYFSPAESTKATPQGTWGTGKNMGKVGTLSLYQLDESGNEVYVGDVGTGLTDLNREEMLTWKWPKCVQIEFEERFYIKGGDDSNKLQLPRYKGIREDKSVDECINPEL
jgi:predicted DNA-binding WGR domain protein